MKAARERAQRVAAGAALALALAVTPAFGQETAAPRHPYELVRTLQALQNQAAQGNVAAHIGQRSLLKEMEAPLSAPDADWRDPRNVRAVVLYVLSGGSPGPLRRLVERDVQTLGADAALARGALAYVMGDEETARKLIGPVKPTELPAALGAQVALVQAALATRNDVKQALQLLDQARLLAPGSLVEEAALRREVFIAGETGDHDRLEKATSQYMRRFGRSVYAEHFRQSFASAVVRFDIGTDAAKFPRLERTMAAFDDSVQRAVFLVIARDALVHGRLPQARVAALAAERTARGDQAALARARLYGAAARVGAENPEITLAALDGVETARLPEADRPLFDAARRIAAGIRAPAQGQATAIRAPGGKPAAEAAPPSAPPAGLDPQARAMRLIAAAERNLSETSALMTRLDAQKSPPDTRKIKATRTGDARP